MANMALIVLTGRLGKDAELKFTAQGTAIGKWSIGVNTGYPKEKEICSWYNCSMFGARAEKLVQFLGKGALITVIGEPHVREWEKDGKRGTAIEVNVQNVTLLGTGKNGKGFNNEPENQAPAKDGTSQEELPSGDVPF